MFLPRGHWMHCGACGHDNRPGRRFCGGCGGALDVACARCGFANGPTERFCGGCGAAVDAAAASPPSPPPPSPPGPVAGERRQVAILFADLAGYTRLSTTLDPEEVHRLLTGFFEVVDGACLRFGGAIDKHIGDNVMAVFGAPVAHGDDPERAVRAAVAIHADLAAYAVRVGQPLAVTIGIAYGEVVASGLGSSHYTEYTMTGDAVNLASRLQGRAGHGETLISDAVHQAAARIAIAEPVGDLAIRSLDTPVPVWRLRGVREAAATAPAHVVGRDDVLARIDARLEDARARGASALIVLRGEPGIGKSTLAAEAARRAGAAGMAVHRAQALDFGAGRGAGAIPTLVASLLGATGSDDDARRAALDDAVRAGRVDDADAPHVAGLLELDHDAPDLDERERRARQLASLAALVHGLAAPPLLVVEDVHWADAPTVAQLRALTRALADVPGALLVTTRFDGDPVDRAWREAAATPPLELELEPLDAVAAAALAAAHLRDAELVARCVERAGGNPLFLEQLVHAATRDASLPGTLQGLVLARVDRLAARDKAALQAAAVVGQRFDLAVVRHLTADATWTADELIARRLVRAAGDDDDLMFHHALILDGIYASLTHARRRELHHAAASYFATRDPELRAEHLDRAGDAEAAAAWLACARDRAARHDVDRALGLAARGLARAAAPELRHDLQMLIGRLQLDVGNTVLAAAAFTAALADAGTDAARCRAAIGLGAAHRAAATTRAALDALDQAEPIARALGLEAELSQIAYHRGGVEFAIGSPTACLAHHTRALDHARRAGAPDLEVRALSGIGDAHYASVRLEEAEAAFVECVARCERLELVRFGLINQAMIANSVFYLLRIDEAEAIVRRAAEEAARLGAARAEVLALESLVKIRVDAGRFDGVPELIEDVRAKEAVIGARLLAVMIGWAEIELRLSRGERDLAVARGRELAATAGASATGMMRDLLEISTCAVAPTPAARAAAVAAVMARVTDDRPMSAMMCRRGALDILVRDGAWDQADDVLARLRATPPALPPYFAFAADRFAAVIAWGRGDRSAAMRAELGRLRGIAATHGIGLPLPDPDAADSPMLLS